jgi:hypothetical protein
VCALRRIVIVALTKTKLIIGRGVNTSPPVWVGRLPMGIDAARLKIEFFYYLKTTHKISSVKTHHTC